ncbi:MAG: ABC transporter ATP-binding protein, partial [Acidimicrobiales bacterium]|nr:ABC transporter ATP-binding protein [Acidimicrobiales bacterium]
GRLLVGPSGDGRDRRRRWRPAHVRGAPSWQRGVGLLRQSPELFPHLSVGQNLTYARSRLSDDEVSRLVTRFGLEDLLDAPPGALSGGQAQRVALARSLISRHRALLLDEPYDGLDPSLRHQLTALVRDEVKDRGVPAVLVAHELAAAQAFADRLGILHRGRLLQVGSPHDVVHRPASQQVASLVGYRGFVPIGSADGPAGEARVVAVHPERVRAGAHPDLGPVLSAEVIAVRPAGAGFELDLVAEGAPIVWLSAELPPAPGEWVKVTVLDPPCFDADGTALTRPEAAWR